MFRVTFQGVTSSVSYIETDVCSIFAMLCYYGAHRVTVEPLDNDIP